MENDTKASDENDTLNDNPNANGHSSIICALLRLCNKDEKEEERMEKETFSETKKITPKEEAARDRIQSELESYPATLANIIYDAPCFQKVLLTKKQSKLIIHIIGASVEAELWNMTDTSKKQTKLLHSYAEALSDLAESFSIPSIHLVFIGPSCPSKNMHISQKIPTYPQKKKKFESILHVHTYSYIYNETLRKELSQSSDLPSSKPDIIALFNPGFTCTDYDWEETLSSLPSFSQSSSKHQLKEVEDGTPFLITTNTEMEAVLDCQYLFDRGCISELPLMVQAMINAENEYGPTEGRGRDEDDNDEEHEMINTEEDNNNSMIFFGENPYAGSRIRQSGTMANDVFVKNMFMFGGPSLSKMKRTKLPSSTKYQNKSKDQKKKKRKNSSDIEEDIDHHPREKKKTKSKKYKVVGKGNSKKNNPALI